MKKLFLTTIFFFLLCVVAKSQVGIGTDEPKATLDIVADANKEALSGVLIPRMTGDEIEAMSVGKDQNSMLVYATEISTSESPVIKSVGFWYYDAESSAWKSINNNTGSTAKPFYMPSFNLPIDTLESKEFNLYEEYVAQLGKAQLQVYDIDDISFEIIYFDESIIEIEGLDDNSGTLYYKVLNTEPPSGAFINIVIIPKN